MLGTCLGLAIDLAGRRRGLGRANISLISKMAKSSRLVPVCLLQVVAFMNSQLRLCMRISDGRPVMMKRLLKEEGPYELQINKLFSTEPLSSDPRNHCARLLDVIQLPNEPPIMVHPLLRPFNDPRLQTYGEFVTFFTQICEVCHLP